MDDEKPVAFCGRSLDDLRAFPDNARSQAGHQIDQVQRGLAPDDWRPMASIGAGVQEIRIKTAEGAFRIIYVAKFDDAVYVLHCFQKKTEKTRQTDIDTARKRYAEITNKVKS